MPARTRHSSNGDLARCQIAYFVELARRTSYIASTTCTASRQNAIAEAFDNFVAQFGTRDLPAFAELLASRLEERRELEAASAVREHPQ